MWDVIRGLVREGTTLLLTTQYLEEADELADTIAVVDHGRIIARGTADELKAQVGGERIEVVVHERDDDPARRPRCWPASARAHVEVDDHTRKLTVPTSRGAAALTQVVRELDEAGIQIDDIGLRRPTLDDVFLSLTGHATDRGGRGMTTDGRRRPDPRRRVVGPAGQGSAGRSPTALLITWRNLKRIPRIPELAIFAILQSIMFVLLFAFVFGGAIVLPGYTDPNATAST